MTDTRVKVLREADVMASWCERNAYHPAVLAWLEKFPPPADWQGTRIQWAYLEMLGAPK